MHIVAVLSVMTNTMLFLLISCNIPLQPTESMLVQFDISLAVQMSSSQAFLQQVLDNFVMKP